MKTVLISFFFLLFGNTYSQGIDNKLEAVKLSLPVEWTFNLTESELIISKPSDNRYIDIRLNRFEIVDSTKVQLSLLKFDSILQVLQKEHPKCKIRYCDDTHTFIQYATVKAEQRAKRVKEKASEKRSKRCSNFDTAYNEFVELINIVPTYFSEHYSFGWPIMNYKYTLCDEEYLLELAEEDKKQIKIVEQLIDENLKYTPQH